MIYLVKQNYLCTTQTKTAINSLNFQNKTANLVKTIILRGTKLACQRNQNRPVRIRKLKTCNRKMPLHAEKKIILQ